MIKRLLSVVLLLGMTVPAFADYQLVVPQRPGGGTDTWARIIALELEKTLGERIIVVNFPGREDIPGFNKFHNDTFK